MLDSGRNPDRAMRRDDPGSLFGFYGEHTVGGVGELVPFVTMGLQHVAFGKGDSKGADEDRAVGGFWRSFW